MLRGLLSSDCGTTNCIAPHLQDANIDQIGRISTSLRKKSALWSQLPQCMLQMMMATYGWSGRPSGARLLMKTSASVSLCTGQVLITEEQRAFQIIMPHM